MKRWLRRIRGAVGIGLAWALAWFGAGVVLLIAGVSADVPFPLGFGFLGFLAGVTFSGVLGMGEGRRSFEQMSLLRFAGWGAVGGLLLSVIFVLAVALAGDTTLIGDLVFLGPLFAVAGAGSAAGSLALARKAEDRQSLEVNGAELADGEAQDWLGGGG